RTTAGLDRQAAAETTTAPLGAVFSWAMVKQSAMDWRAGGARQTMSVAPKGPESIVPRLPAQIADHGGIAGDG
ncbi:MAG TPA: hypothetical protein PK510_12835, partial [Ottowia sp.]|nr:hypothetical protein [Ottowia sp.]